MSTNLYLVFSRKPDRISREEYHEWYVKHAQENIESTGFISAQRYIVREVHAGQPIGEEKHLALYEHEGDMSIWRKDLTRRIEAGDVVLPEWFKEIQFASWTCTPVGDLLRPKSH